MLQSEPNCRLLAAVAELRDALLVADGRWDGNGRTMMVRMNAMVDRTPTPNIAVPANPEKRQ